MASHAGKWLLERMNLTAGNLILTLSPESLEQDIAEVFRHFDKMFSDASHERVYVVAGSKFTVRSSAESYLKTTDAALASGGTAHGPASQIVVAVAGAKPAPVLHWGNLYLNERQVEASLAETRYRLHYFPDKSFWQLFDRETNTGIQIMSAPNGYPDWDPGSPLRNFLQWHLAGCGGGLIHAGTLGVGTKGVLLAGAGGSGKSGTVLSGILHGLSTAGDDYVFAKPDALTAHALFETLKQDEGGLDRLDLLDNPAIPKYKNWQGKYQFYLRDFKDTAQAHALELHALLLPTITGTTRTSITPTSSKEAFLALAPSGVSQIPGDRRVLYAVAAEVSRRLPCYRLHLGSDPAEVSNAIRTFIGEI